MDNRLNNKMVIYWVAGIVVVIAVFLGLRYWGGNSNTSNINLENNATNTENIDLNNKDKTIRPNVASSTIKTPIKTIPQNNFDYKG